MTLLNTPAAYSTHPTHCPHCSSEQDIIAWGSGWMCRDCGHEWVMPIQNNHYAVNSSSHKEAWKYENRFTLTTGFRTNSYRY
nr:hypothetical protein [Providencia heimbachae]